MSINVSLDEQEANIAYTDFLIAIGSRDRQQHRNLDCKVSIGEKFNIQYGDNIGRFRFCKKGQQGSTEVTIYGKGLPWGLYNAGMVTCVADSLLVAAKFMGLFSSLIGEEKRHLTGTAMATRDLIRRDWNNGWSHEMLSFAKREVYMALRASDSFIPPGGGLEHSTTWQAIANGAPETRIYTNRTLYCKRCNKWFAVEYPKPSSVPEDVDSGMEIMPPAPEAYYCGKSTRIGDLRDSSLDSRGEGIFREGRRVGNQIPVIFAPNLQETDHGDRSCIEYCIDQFFQRLGPLKKNGTEAEWIKRVADATCPICSTHVRTAPFNGDESEQFSEARVVGGALPKYLTLSVSASPLVDDRAWIQNECVRSIRAVYPTNTVSENGTFRQENALYKWVGGVYSAGNHARLYWASPTVPGGLLMYDGEMPIHQKRRAHVGPILEFSAESMKGNRGRVPNPWAQKPTMLFYEKQTPIPM